MAKQWVWFKICFLNLFSTFFWDPGNRRRPPRRPGGRRRAKHEHLYKNSIFDIFGFQPKKLSSILCFHLFHQHLLEGLLNFRRRGRRSFWLHFVVQDPPGNEPILLLLVFVPHKDFCIAKSKLLIECPIPCSGHKLRHRGTLIFPPSPMPPV